MEFKNALFSYLENLFTLAGIKTASEDAEKISGSFSSLLYVLHMDAYSLVSVSGCSDTAAELIRLTAALTSRRITDRFKIGRKYTESEIRDFVVGRLFGLEYESVFALFFDASGKMMPCEHICDGSVNAAGLIPRKIIDFGKRHGAASVVLMHNHPLGIPRPSQEDVKTAATVAHILGSAGIKCEHNYVVWGFDISDAQPLVKESTDCLDDGGMLQVSSLILGQKYNKGKI